MSIAGKSYDVSCTPLYAPPEALKAHETGEPLTVEASFDMWSIGVIVYECLAGCRAFRPHSAAEEVFECAHAMMPYPWEQPLENLPKGWSKSRTRTFFSGCLQRDPAARPTAAQLLSSMHKLNNTTIRASR
jgi:serine/threonine protein kinase